MQPVTLAKGYTTRRLDLNAHKDSAIVQRYIQTKLFLEMPSYEVTHWFMPQYSAYNFHVIEAGKTVGYLIKGHFIETKVKL